jgi:hypothetical protein
MKNISSVNSAMKRQRLQALGPFLGKGCNFSLPFGDSSLLHFLLEEWQMRGCL